MSATVSKSLKVDSLELFRNYRKSPSPNLRNELIEINIGLVNIEVKYWINQCQESYEDLMQVGCIGLLRAVEKYDLDKGYAFSTFAIPYIRGEIQHYLRDKSSCVRIPRRWEELIRQANTITKNYHKHHNRPPKDSEIAKELGIELKQWQKIKLAYKNREPISLDVSVGDEFDHNTSLGDLVPDGHYRSFQLAQDDKLRLQSALGQLEDKTRNILEFVFLYDLTQKETAERLGISVVTVSRRVKKGLDKLKTLMVTEIC